MIKKRKNTKFRYGERVTTIDGRAGVIVKVCPVGSFSPDDFPGSMLARSGENLYNVTFSLIEWKTYKESELS